MSCERQIPYAVMNWRILIEEDFFFVDHTRYLHDLETYRTPVFLRPKRFGKSLWASMLEHYYDVRFRGDFAKLFGKTDVGRKPTRLANSFLVLSLDFSTIEVGTRAEIEANFTDRVLGDIDSFVIRNRSLAEWPDVKGAKGAAQAIDWVRKVIRDNGLPPLYVIIDEYDNFTNQLVTSGRDADYDAICGRADGTPTPDSFFKAFFKSLKEGLKDGTVAEADRTRLLEKDRPEPADVRQVLDYLESLARDPNWSHGRNVEVVIVEVGGSRGYNWFPVDKG